MPYGVTSRRGCDCPRWEGLTGPCGYRAACAECQVRSGHRPMASPALGAAWPRGPRRVDRQDGGWAGPDPEGPHLSPALPSPLQGPSWPCFWECGTLQALLACRHLGSGEVAVRIRIRNTKVISLSSSSGAHTARLTVSCRWAALCLSPGQALGRGVPAEQGPPMWGPPFCPGLLVLTPALPEVEAHSSSSQGPL